MEDIIEVDGVLAEKSWQEHGSAYKISFDMTESAQDRGGSLSQYPLNIWNCPDDQVDAMKEGVRYTILIKKGGKLKKYEGKEDKAYMFNYYWSSIVGAAERAAEPTVTKGGSQDEFRRSKEEVRRTDTAVAAVLAAHYKVPEKELLRYWKAFCRVVEDGFPDPKPVEAQVNADTETPPVDVEPDGEPDGQF